MEPLTPAGQSDHGPPDPLPPPSELCRCSWPGCKYPDKQHTDRAFVVVNGRDYCHLHAEAAINGERFSLAVKPLVGTGEP
jgi:hypothetical protein